jgi:arsenate reductase
MENTVFFLETCSTSQRIIKTLGLQTGFRLREIKSIQITPEELDYLKELAGSYEALFSRRAREYSARNLKNQPLEESDYRKLILEEYTFLKRPVVVYNGKIFVGSGKETVRNLAKWL